MLGHVLFYPRLPRPLCLKPSRQALPEPHKLSSGDDGSGSAVRQSSSIAGSFQPGLIQILSLCDPYVDLSLTTESDGAQTGHSSGPGPSAASSLALCMTMTSSV